MLLLASARQPFFSKNCPTHLGMLVTVVIIWRLSWWVIRYQVDRCRLTMGRGSRLTLNLKSVCLVPPCVFWFKHLSRDQIPRKVQSILKEGTSSVIHPLISKLCLYLPPTRNMGTCIVPLLSCKETIHVRHRYRFRSCIISYRLVSKSSWR